MKLTVHCPSCGGNVEVPVMVKAVEVSRMGQQIEVYFQDKAVDHTCRHRQTEA